MPEVVIGWCAHRWAGIGGVKFDIWEGTVYFTPIWGVSVPQEERDAAGEHMCTRTRSPGSQLGSASWPWCSVLLLGSLGLVSHGKKYVY